MQSSPPIGSTGSTINIIYTSAYEKSNFTMEIQDKDKGCRFTPVVHEMET